MPKNQIRIKKTNMLNISKKDRRKISEMFNELIGVKHMKKDIVLKKIVDILKHINNIYNLFNLFIKVDNLKDTLYPNYDKYINELNLFLKNIKETFTDFDKDSDLLYFKLSSGKSEEELNNLYNKYIKSEPLKNIIISTKNMNKYTKILKIDAPIIIGTTDKFISDRVGLEFKPLNFVDLDFKNIWFELKNNNTGKKFFLGILKNFYNNGYKIYDVLVRPRVDISECSELLLNSILKLRKLIPGCNDAFNAIKNSIDLFKTNFNEYYKSFIRSGDTSIILSDFISDMCLSYKNQVELPKLTRQLEKIGNYVVSRLPRNRNSKVNDLIKILRSNIDIMKTKTTEKIDININDKNINTNEKNTNDKINKNTIDINENENKNTIDINEKKIKKD